MIRLPWSTYRLSFVPRNRAKHDVVVKGSFEIPSKAHYLKRDQASLSKKIKPNLTVFSEAKRQPFRSRIALSFEVRMLEFEAQLWDAQRVESSQAHNVDAVRGNAMYPRKCGYAAALHKLWPVLWVASFLRHPSCPVVGGQLHHRLLKTHRMDGY